MPKRKYRSENFGQDDGIIEKSYWVPSSKVACVASVSSRGSSRKLGQEHFRSNFRAITRLETLATQATSKGACSL